MVKTWRELLNSEDAELYLSDYQTKIWNLFKASDTLNRKQIFEITNIPLATIEHSVRKLLSMNKIIAIGEGRSREYRMKTIGD